MLLELVVQDWNFHSRLVLELGPLQRVSENYRQAHSKRFPHRVQEVLPHELHCGVPDFVISDLFKLAVVRQFDVLCEHVNLWDSYVVKSQVSVVLGIVPELAADIADLDARQRLMCLGAPDRDHKDLDTVLLAVNNQLALGDDVSRCDSHIRAPPFRGAHVRSVNNKLFGLFVVNCSRLEPVDIRPMR